VGGIPGRKAALGKKCYNQASIVLSSTVEEYIEILIAYLAAKSAAQEQILISNN
jgi:hypothetical protein